MCNMALVEDFLDEVALSDNDSESEQLHESTVYLKKLQKKKTVYVEFLYLDYNIWIKMTCITLQFTF